MTTSTLRLYELGEQYARILWEQERGDGEEGVDLEAALDAVGDAFYLKAENVAKYILSVEAEAEALKNEAVRLAERAQSLSNRGKWLRNYLARNLAEMSDDTVRVPDPKKGEGPSTLAITLSKVGQTKLIVLDEDAVPGEFKKAVLEMPAEKVEPELATFITNIVVAKADMNEHFKQTGEIPPGCGAQPGTRSLSIK